jgi:uncharacterized protein (TIGR02231 family)
MSLVAFPLALFVLALEPAFAQEPVSLDSKIVEVTVYGGSASVRRRASLPAAGGKVVLAGLPAALDPESVRVRCEGGEVIGVETRDRVQRSVPDARLAELAARVKERQRALAVLEDERSVMSAMSGHVQRLLAQEEEIHAGEVRNGRPDPESWKANMDFLRRELGDLAREGREQDWRLEEARVALAEAETALGAMRGGAGVRVRDVLVDVLDAQADGGVLEVEYVVGNAGWHPLYDLRAKKDLSGVELVYRARVWQQSGEDWKEAAILLSTAQPQRGAQGPDPLARWVSLFDPRGRALARASGAEAPADKDSGDRRASKQAQRPAAGGPTSPGPGEPVFAAVQSEGLSVRFRLARTETIESRPQPTTVLIGRKDLAIAPEHYVVPELDLTVWLRAKAKNTSEWVMLPGRASVYFGADFVGQAELEAVQVGQELVLHLGADPGLTVTRTETEDLLDQPGVFGSKTTRKRAWKIAVANHGAFSAARDGAVDVIVHEVLPKATDDRIDVSIRKAAPALREDERWKKEREERGVLTWVLRVPRGATQTIELATSIAYPEDLELVEQ